MESKLSVPTNHAPISLIFCEARRGYAYGFLQPVIVGQLALNEGISIPLGKIDAVMQALFQQLDPLTAPPERPRDALGFCNWMLHWSYRVQRAHKLVVVQSPRIVAHVMQNGQFQVVFAAPYFNAALGLAALKWVVDTVAQFLLKPDAIETTGLETATQALRELSKAMRRFRVEGINLDRMLRSAVDNKVPFTHLGMQTFQLGQGVNSRWIRSSFTDATSYLGATYARNKLATGVVLAFHGLPVADHRSAENAEDAVRAAEAIGYPVVVKAADLDGGVGIHAGLHTAEQVSRCFEEARRHTKNVMVERFQLGADYRLTVIHGEVVKVVQRVPGGVVGDGQLTVAQLLRSALQDDHHQRRMRERGKLMLKLDEEALELLQTRGLGPDSVLPAGEFVALRRRANVSTGGSTHAIALEDIHPANRLLAIRAAAALRLDVAGIDLILPDIRRSWFETGGIICEVNGQPQFGENNAPGLYLQFFRSLLGGDGRIPIALVAYATPVDSSTVQRWRSTFAQQSSGDALVFDGLLYIDGVPVSPQRKTNHEQTCAALASQEVTRLLVVLSLKELAAQGMPVQQVDQVVLLVPADTSTQTTLRIKGIRTAIEPHVMRGLEVSQDQEGKTWLKKLTLQPEPSLASLNNAVRD